GTDLRIRPFIIARVLQAFVAGFYTYLLIGMVKLPEALPAARTFTGGILNRWMLSGKQFLIITGLLIVAGLFMRFLSGYRLVCRGDRPGPQGGAGDGKSVAPKVRT